MATSDDTFRVGFLLFPNLTQLDLTGPLEVFSRVPGWDVQLIWKTLDPITADRGRLRMLPTTTFDTCPPLDLICVPGGPGQIELMEDEPTLDFLRRVAPQCRLITSVCTGSLVLAAAGLLRGYRAACHWSSLDQLSLLGAEPVDARIVRDRDRMTGAGVTSGIDFALAVVADLVGRDVAEEMQLQLEYDPDPPFIGGSPRSAPPALTEALRAKIAPFIARRRAATERAATNLSPSPPHIDRK